MMVIPQPTDPDARLLSLCALARCHEHRSSKKVLSLMPERDRRDRDRGRQRARSPSRSSSGSRSPRRRRNRSYSRSPPRRRHRHDSRRSSSRSPQRKRKHRRKNHDSPRRRSRSPSGEMLRTALHEPLPAASGQEGEADSVTAPDTVQPAAPEGDEAQPTQEATEVNTDPSTIDSAAAGETDTQVPSLQCCTVNCRLVRTCRQKDVLPSKRGTIAAWGQGRVLCIAVR